MDIHIPNSREQHHTRRQGENEICIQEPKIIYLISFNYHFHSEWKPNKADITNLKFQTFNSFKIEIDFEQERS